MLVIKPKCITNTSFPLTPFAMILIFFQGPLSFKADYCNMTNDSIYHVIDRFMAVINSFFYVTKFATYFWHGRTSTAVCQIAALIVTMLCFMKSQKAQIMQNPDDFCLWHTMWHIGPLIGTVIDSVEVFILEKRDSLEDLMHDGVDENRGRYSNIKND